MALEAVPERLTNLNPEEDEVVLISCDNDTFVVKRNLCMKYSGTLSALLEDLPLAREVPLPNVNAATLAKFLEYVNKHGQTVTKDGEEDKPANTEEELKAWDAEYVKVDQATLFEIILAANYLDSKELLDLTCQTVANMIKGKTPEEIRKTFNIENDFTPEEEEEVRRENAWAFE